MRFRITSRTTIRAAVAVAALAAASLSSLAAASPASAAASKPLQILYSATGSTTLSNPNSGGAVIDFKPSTLQSFVTFGDGALSGTIKAYLPLAPVTASFKAYGFLPSRSTVVFTQVGPATGTLGQYDPETGFPLSVTARYVVTLSNVVIGGTRVDVGTNCQTTHPLAVTVTAAPGFDLVNGSLSGTYDLSRFNNCGQASTIINSTVPGKGNRLNLDIVFGGGADRAAVARAAAAAGAR